MSCKSLIYLANTSTQSLSDGDTISVGNIVRRFGCNLGLNGDSIVANGTGYYAVDAEITLVGTETGTAVITLYKDGVPVIGATASVGLATGSVATIGLNAVIREVCCKEASNLTFVLSGVGADVSNMSTIVYKL